MNNRERVTQAVCSLERGEVRLNRLDNRLGKLDWMNPEISRRIDGDSCNVPAQPPLRHLQSPSILLRQGDLMQ
jgi:hypothetical protein